MIHTDDQLAAAERAVADLKKVLIAARQVHAPREYRAMSQPILLEIQRRDQEILDYLSKTKAEIPVS